MNFNETTTMENDTSYQLNYVESLWEGMYEGRNPLVVTGIFAFLMHEIVYFGRFIPFLICDFIPYFNKYKLQPVSNLFFFLPFCLYVKFLYSYLFH